MNYDLLASSRAKSSLLTDPPRCTFRKSHGHRCKMLALSGTPFCFSHQPKPEPDPVIAPELAEAGGALASPEDVHRALAKIFQLLAEDRISFKKAGVFCFLTQNILRAQREITIKQKLQAELGERNRPRRPRTWNVPTGIRPDPVTLTSTESALR
jgi:hypothetical protein